MSDAELQRLERYLARPLPALEEELELYAPGMRGVGEVWRKVSAPVHQWLCVDWDWCHVRQDARFENDYDLGVAILAILIQHIGEMPLNVDHILITAILVKRGMDAFCGCPYR